MKEKLKIVKIDVLISSQAQNWSIFFLVILVNMHLG